MKNSTKFRIRNAATAVSLVVLYGIFVAHGVYSSWEKPVDETFWPYLPLVLALAIFVLLCSYFSGVMMGLAGAAAVVILPVTSATIHFVSGEMSGGGGDFSGLRGALYLALILGAVYMYMFLATAGLAIAARYSIRKISVYKRRRRS